MAVKKYAVAVYNDEAVLFPAVKNVRKKGYKIHDVFTPFAVHGLDEALGYKTSDLHVAGFIYGITGTSTALGFMGWIFTTEWPQNFGGKPHFPLPAFIPIVFELTVLFAAVGMVLTFCYLCQIMPGVKKHLFHPRQTDDKFVMTIEVDDNNAAEVQSYLASTGAEETNVQVAEEGWWYGKWDKKEDYEINHHAEAMI
jgi:hypothetical protein